MHQQQLNILGVVNEEGLVAGGHHVTSLLVGAETDRGHGHAASESSSDSVVDTLRLTPAGGEAFEPIALVSVEALGSLLDDRDMLLCGNHLD